jgi:hypothetical protein
VWLEKEDNYQRANQCRPVVMGPGVRRDDEMFEILIRKCMRRSRFKMKTPPGIGRRFDSVVQRSLDAMLHGNGKISILVAGVDPVELAQ